MAARDIHGVDAPWEEFRVVGKSHRKIDGVAKATGEAVYADDIQLPRMLHAKIIRCPHPHASGYSSCVHGMMPYLTGMSSPVMHAITPSMANHSVVTETCDVFPNCTRFVVGTNSKRLVATEDSDD